MRNPPGAVEAPETWTMLLKSSTEVSPPPHLIHKQPGPKDGGSALLQGGSSIAENVCPVAQSELGTAPESNTGSCEGCDTQSAKGKGTLTTKSELKILTLGRMWVDLT